MKDQQEAEKKKVQSQEIQHQLAIQTVAINQKRDDVMADLALVEPAVIDAQNGTYIQLCIFFVVVLYHTTSVTINIRKVIAPVVWNYV